MQLVPGEGPDPQGTSCNRANEHGSSDSKSNGQKLDVHIPSPSNDSQKDQVTRGTDYLLEEGSNDNDDEALDPTTPINQRDQKYRHIVKIGRCDLSNLALYCHRAHISSFKSSLCFSNFRFFAFHHHHRMASETSPSPSAEGNPLSDNLIFDTPLSSNPPSSPSGTNTQPSLSSKMHSLKAVPVSSTAISHGGSRPASDVGNYPFIQESGEPSSQEAPTIVASPKWDGTPTQLDVGIPETTTLYGIAKGTSSPPDDDEVPIHLVFKRKSHYASRLSLQGSTGTQGGPSTRGTIKKSLDLILEESHQNTLKRCRVTRKTVLDEEDPSSPIVDLDTSIPSQPTEEIPKTYEKAHRDGGVSKKGKKLVVVEKPIEGPSAPVLRSKRKHFIDKSSKGKRTVSTTLGADVKE
ncbi:hypothetical protein HAX54_045918 [Datura stramonium]|uniref:Uncharacterized protein n=1 Tax=Datura stramonium TaxID=4076 RepID=A0ABS8SR20_DATST|nr:hypothetical protein [Datura stramonium]